MRHPFGLSRLLGGFIGGTGPGILMASIFGMIGARVGNCDASFQVAWESPAATAPQVLKDFSLAELEKRKLALLTEVDPLGKDPKETAKFLGLSLSALVEETTKSLTAADRATTDLVVLKARDGKEALMPKAFLVKYPQIQLALKKNGQTLAAEAPRVILPVMTNLKIKSENILLEPLFLSELVSVTLTSYEKRYGAFILTRRTDPAAMRGEKMYLQNCVSCHAQPRSMNTLASADKIEKIGLGQHPSIPGVHEFKSIFDRKSARSLMSYLEAFKFQTAKN